MVSPNRHAMLAGVKLDNLAWEAIEESLWQSGYAKLPAVLTAAECAELVALYPRQNLFRSRIEMARYRFGVGDYQYFDYPLPETVRELREHSYPPLAAIANRWMEALGEEARFPAGLDLFRARSAGRPGRVRRRRCSCTMRRAATTACTRISTANWRSLCSLSAS
jgi:hypothetical protein